MLKPRTRWMVKEADMAVSKKIAEELNIAPVVASLLVNRGIGDTEAANRFLHIEKEPFHDPFLLNDMEMAAARVRSAIEKGEHILVYGDYDADGVTSTSVMMTVLKDLGANADFYIPNRFTEGYGPNEAAFRTAAENGTDLIITVDTGISALKEAEIARELGMDLIITDHHEPGPILPEAYAIIHPKRPDSKYPFTDLAGVGVAFKFAHALYGTLPEHLLDLAAIGTIADLVPLHGENRLIAKKGLQHLAGTNRIGIRALCETAGANLAGLNEETVGFALAPRLNAAGRLDSADPAVELLMTEDRETAVRLAWQIDAMNKERQQLVSETSKEAIAIVEESFPPDGNKVIVVGQEGWNPGIIGIVASRLADAFYRPAIVLSYDSDTGLAKGSARSIPGFDLFKNLSANRDLLPHFGGHPMAAGMTLDIKNVDELRSRLNAAAEAQLTPEQLIPVTDLDAALDVGDISLESISQLGMLAPYGMSNPKPLIFVKPADVSGIRKIGGNQTHLKLTLENAGHSLDAVGFGLGTMADHISPGSKLSAIGELSINEWNNMRKPQILLKDIAVTEWQLFDMRGHKQASNWIPKLPEEDLIFVVFHESSMSMLREWGAYEKSLLIENEEQAKNLGVDDKSLVLFDLPPNMPVLETLIKEKSPARIYAHFYKEQDDFFSTMPTRDHFKWYYAFLAKRKSFNVRLHGDELAKIRGWSKSTVRFMSQVFFELGFVTINDGIITLNQTKLKRDLTEAPSYQQKKEMAVMEDELLYSPYQQLKKWFDVRVASPVTHKEEAKAWT
ncbi:MAG TPA: single-stranded-DNA-specific exonuclease RecJ [Bacillaceae bacterium]